MSSLTLGSQGSRVSITDFPPELLLMVFKDLYNLAAADREMWNQFLPHWEERDDSRVPSLFPYALASVSKFWSDIMAMVPEFWTRVVIFIDSNEFSLSSISSHLSYSSRLPINVRVTKKTPNLLPTSESQENLRLQAIIDIIRPHIHRCRSLRYEVTYSSSLPRISKHLQGIFPLLIDLRLEASKASETVQTPADLEWDIQCPSLVCLALDGLNFIDLFKNAQDLLNQVQRKREPSTRVAISHLHQPPNDTHRLSLGDVWPFISQTCILHLEDLDLDCDADDMYEVQDFPEPQITLVDLNNNITSAVLSSYEFIGSLEIVRCCLDTLAYIPYAEPLYMDGIDDAESLAILLPGWDGQILQIRNCPGFNDTVLNVIGTHRHPFSNLQELSIVNCFNFSTAVLRHTIEHCININAGGIVRVYGRNVPMMTEQEKGLFVTNKISLSWNE